MLPNQLHSGACVDLAVMASAILRGAADRLVHIQRNGIQQEIRATAMINPNSPVVVVPGRSLHTRRAAALVDHLNALMGVGVAVVAASVLG